MPLLELVSMAMAVESQRLAEGRVEARLLAPAVVKAMTCDVGKKAGIKSISY